MTLRRSAPSLLLAAMLAGTAAAAEKGLPVPRFVALRSDQVNLRAGPGERYPIEWVYVRKELPVEIVAEFDIWRRIRDSDGTVGWVHEKMVTGKRTVLVSGTVRSLRSSPEPAAGTVARVEPGVIAHLLECRGPWCRVEASGYKGWLQRTEVWGVYAEETVQ